MRKEPICNMRRIEEEDLQRRIAQHMRRIEEIDDEAGRRYSWQCYQCWRHYQLTSPPTSQPLAALEDAEAIEEWRWKRQPAAGYPDYIHGDGSPRNGGGRSGPMWEWDDYPSEPGSHSYDYWRNANVRITNRTEKRDSNGAFERHTLSNLTHIKSLF
jgi:hypothetical protein